MAKYNLKELDNLEKGRYGEGLIKLKFRHYGFDIYDPKEIGNSMGFRAKKDSDYYDVRVRTARKLTNVYLKKQKVPLEENTLLALVIFREDMNHDFYLIPLTIWKNPDNVFVSRNFDKEGQVSDPEWAINLSQKNLSRLEPYRFINTISRILQF
ncbi:hypothetical protein PDN20_14670 [Bacillus cereus]|nr:hypothetical protein [Bacillus cereus]MDA2127191.1 hypothetical protein [Bacillus cereus]MDA2149923.1 hypothetical protein [Bacillus cereus]MEB9164005.1 hypothetical protein [Bacillus cereus]